MRAPPSKSWRSSRFCLASAGAWCERGGDWTSGAHATFSIVDADGGYVGNVSLLSIDDEQHNASIGYRVMSAHRGRGAATAAVAAVSDWAFTELGIERIRLEHAIDNVASCRVAEKCGYLLEGTMRSGSVYGDGRRRDEHLHARLRAD